MSIEGRSGLARNRKVKLSSIAPVPKSGISAGLVQFLETIKERLELREGNRGDPLEQALTKRDLIDSGIAKLSNAAFDLEPTVVVAAGASITPAVPIGFTASGTFDGITLSWESPFKAYSVHGYTEVWRGDTNDRAEAILLNSSRGSVFFDRIPDPDLTPYWYWIRYVSEFNKMGPWSQPVTAAKLEDMGELLDRLTGEIDESMLSQEFTNKVADIGNSYVVKLDPTGAYAAGFGLYNDGVTSDFAVLADRFWIGSPGVAKAKPFIVQDGNVYMDTAFIREASIQQGQIGAISFGKITDSSGNAVTTVGGQLRAEMLDVENLRVTDANINGVIKSGAVASNGQPRWLLDKNGGMTLNGSGTGGRMEIRDTVIKVFDNNGVLRVQLGDLTL